MMFVLLTIWFTFNLVLVENLWPLKRDIAYCRSHACIPFVDYSLHNSKVISLRMFTYNDWGTIFGVGRNMPEISEYFQQLTTYLDPANQTAPKLLQHSPNNNETMDVFVYFPPGHKIIVPDGQYLTISNFLPNQVYVWSFTTDETDPDSRALMAEVRAFTQFLDHELWVYKTDNYMIAFYDDFPFNKKQRYVEIWVPWLSS